MLLDGKYIMVEKDKIGKTLEFLYSIGYDWLHKNGDYIYENLKDKEKIYIFSDEDDNSVIFWDSDTNRHISIKKYIDINKVLRENKLKRILK